MATSEIVLLENRQFSVASDSEALVARRCAKDMARAVGFDDCFSEEVSIVVSELAFNISRHAGRGLLGISMLQHGVDMGVEIVANDEGKGIENVTTALTDGVSTVGGLGCGLGAVKRLMDQMDIVSTQHGVKGTRIRCCRWKKTMPLKNITAPSEIGVISRTKPGEKLNGDSYMVIEDGNHCLVAVIDGVGHGELAYQAAMSVRHYIETHSKEPLDRLIVSASYECQSNRGAVISIARINWAENFLEQAGIGNIETRTLSKNNSNVFLSQRGILGVGEPVVHINRHSWSQGDLLVMFSDGISASWQWDQFPSASLIPAQQFARELFDAKVRQNDDATVLVVKYLTRQNRRETNE